MNLGRWEEALSLFLKYQENKDALRFAGICYQSIGDEIKAAAYQKKFEEMEETDDRSKGNYR